MLKTIFVKSAVGVSAIAALCAALAVQAQTGTAQTITGQTNTGQTTTGQTGGATGMHSGTQAGANTASGSGAMGAATLSQADQKIVKDMAMSNLAEIEAARMAQSKTQNEQVKSFAQKMIDDHTKALGEVQQLAQAKGVALPSEIDRTHKRKAEQMGALSGDAFDRAYMKQAGVDDHKKTHMLLQKAQSRAKDPDVKALAARTMPVVHEHLTSAQELHKDTARGSSRTQGTTGSSPDKTQ